MPILHIQFSGKSKDHQGRDIQLPPGIVLQSKGPCVQVAIGLSQIISQQLLQQGVTLPSPISGTALIDTGASATCVDDTIARQLNLPVINVVNVASASHASTPQNVYPIHIEVVGLPITFEANAIGAALSPQGLIALIGRDVLRHCSFIYNGISGEITLAL